jgi:hypothetical protein
MHVSVTVERNFAKQHEFCGHVVEHDARTKRRVFAYRRGDSTSFHLAKHAKMLPDVSKLLRRNHVLMHGRPQCL